MEALSAIGLVGNILQLVDAAGKAYKVYHEIHTLGASIEDQDMADTSKQLQEAYTALNTSLSRTTSTGSQVLPSRVDLSGHGFRCYETAKALHDELIELRKKPGGGFLESARVSWKKKKKAKGIERIKTRLDENQKVLDTEILIDMRLYLVQQTEQQKEQQKEMSDELQQKLKELSEKLTSFHSKNSDRLSEEIAKAIQASEEQHVRTRTHITSELQNIQLSQEQAQTHREQKQRSQSQRKKFLGSLMFDETNRRMNEIATSHRDTFQWIFDDDPERPWDSFTTWLKGDGPIYWIHGKPGSGKSTLMKFVANASQTKDCLREWYPDDQVLIVKYYFWLSGSHIQRSLKGFLCSIICQIVKDDERLLNTLLDEQPELLMKGNINDWDSTKLQSLLLGVTVSRTLPLCCFIDGLDEFDQGDDVESVLSLIEKISSASKIKFCVSSRPENYLSNRLSERPQLRLQDLTAADMQILISAKLSDARSKCTPASIDDKHMNKIKKTMVKKADGVFLWVRYAISSLVRGMRNEGNFEELLSCIEDLPSGMHELYSQMWNRHNDQPRHREEAAMYFSYCVLETAEPISLFELVIALNGSLQGLYIDQKLPPADDDVAKECERLERLLSIRCAGLLETVTRKPDSRHRGLLPWEDSHSRIQRMFLDGHLLKHHQAKIQFMHRTARDFVLGKDGGRSLLGQPEQSSSLLWRNLIRANMAVIAQGLEGFGGRAVVRNILLIAHKCNENEVELSTTLKHFCERLSIPGDDRRNIGYLSFIRGMDFEGIAVLAGCTGYVQHFLDRRENYLSPYYLGYLVVVCATPYYRPDQLSTISKLISSGADLRTKHVVRYQVHDVVSSVIGFLCRFQPWNQTNGHIAKQAAGIIEQLYVALAGSDFDCLMSVDRQDDWRSFCQLPYTRTQHVVFRSSVTNLCWRTIQFLDLPISSKLRSLQPPLQRDSRTEVLCYRHNEREADGIALNHEDSVLLGQKLDELWSTTPDCSVSTGALIKNFESMLQEVKQRSPRIKLVDWEMENGLRYKHEDLIYNLDPSEDVDESNWREKGWFRKYDARDELHRSPEKLKMIERMERYPREDLEPKDGSSEDGSEDYESDSDSEETTTSGSVGGGTQSEASD